MDAGAERGSLRRENLGPARWFALLVYASAMPAWFPVALALENRDCLVVGGSSEAAERAAQLTQAGARVQVVAEHPGPELTAVLQQYALVHHARAFAAEDLHGMWLAVLGDRDPDTMQRMGAAAEAERVFFCAIDQPERNTFAHMAQARAGLVCVAITTQGQAPALARRLRQELQRLFDTSRLAAFAEQLAELRRVTPSERRREVLGQAASALAIRGSLEVPPPE